MKKSNIIAIALASLVAIPAAAFFMLFGML